MSASRFYGFVLLLSALALLSACDRAGSSNQGDDDSTSADARVGDDSPAVNGEVTVDGAVSKGPFVTGSSASVAILGDSFQPTGETFPSRLRSRRFHHHLRRRHHAGGD